jgi:hypothetical protein
MQVPPISWLPLWMVTFIGAQFGRALSRIVGTAQRAIHPVYAAPTIIPTLNVLLYIQKHGREIYSSHEIAVENTARIEGGTLPAARSLHLSSEKLAVGRNQQLLPQLALH